MTLASRTAVARAASTILAGLIVSGPAARAAMVACSGATATDSTPAAGDYLTMAEAGCRGTFAVDGGTSLMLVGEADEPGTGDQNARTGVGLAAVGSDLVGGGPAQPPARRLPFYVDCSDGGMFADGTARYDAIEVAEYSDGAGADYPVGVGSPIIGSSVNGIAGPPTDGGEPLPSTASLTSDSGAESFFIATVLATVGAVCLVGRIRQRRT